MSDVYDEVGRETFPENTRRIIPFVVDALIRRFLKYDLFQEAHGIVLRDLQEPFEEDRSLIDRFSKDRACCGEPSWNYA